MEAKKLLFFILVTFSYSGNVYANASENVFDILPAVNTVTNIIALTIMPVFLAMISRTKPWTLPKTALIIIIATFLILFGLMGVVLLALLLLKLQHIRPGI